ncbi:hypothetical protein ACQPUY_03395 [Clostridium nigeriense]|uniref:hypothetical protein n=1 Tax=Clostridium nigeriense TaxID=1805470 RepID=UPI003D35728F
MEKSFLIILEKVLKCIISKIDNDGFKGIVPISAVIFLIIIFLSPGYILIFNFKIMQNINSNLIIDISTMIVLDVILFFIIYVASLVMNIEVDEEKHLKESEINIQFDIIKVVTIFGGISTVLFTIYGVILALESSINIKVGLISLAVLLASIIAFYGMRLKKIMKSVKLPSPKKAFKTIKKINQKK